MVVAKGGHPQRQLQRRDISATNHISTSEGLAGGVDGGGQVAE
jgi:hypothetical protein